MLKRPKAASIRHRGASVSTQAGQKHTRTESHATSRLRSSSSLTGVETGEGELVEHGVESRTVTAELPPVMSKVIDEHRLSWVGFEEECVVTACVEGHVRLWRRPVDGVGGEG